jgi:hypothetical protein
LLVSPVPSAAESITAAITAAGGAISFEQYMGLALYGTGGFYQDGGKAGRRGDFITSPEVGPLFAAVVARYLDNSWHELGCPESFDVVEVGAGPGTLARGIFDAQPQCLSAMKYVAVEISKSQRAMHPDFVESAEEFPDRIIQGVVLANELLDNLPFKLFVFDGTWKEAFVGLGDGGKFVEVLRSVENIPEVLPKNARTPEQPAAQCIELIAKMYAVEGNARELRMDAQQRLAHRQAHSVPVTKAIEALVLAHLHTVVPGSALGKALHYFSSQWPKLIRYVQDGRYPIDNNPCENSIRPFVVGRKGWLFSDTVDGANASANLYSLVQTCKANGIDPYRYLAALFTALPNAQSADDYEALMPWRIALPAQ